MFKKTRIKIVAAIMLALVFLLGGTLCVIYLSSYYEVYQQDQEMLVRYIGSHFKNEIPDVQKIPRLDNPPKGFDRDNAFLLSTFYCVVLSEDGEVIRIEDNDGTVHSDDHLAEFAITAVQKGDTHGTLEKLIYRIANGDGVIFVAFMDNTIVTKSITTLFRYTLIFGGIAVILIFFLSLYLARRIVQPLEESYHKQKQFISDAGHELKTPVSVVSTNAELLSREIGENQWLANIQFENGRMAALISQLLELARTENITPNPSQVDFSRIVTGEALPFEGVAFEKGLTLVCDVDEAVYVSGSGDQLGRLVSILIDNAIEHSVADGTVRISLKNERGAARLVVINEGNAIPQEQQKLIFERFYRADPSRTGEDHHYGLGLAIAKAIVNSHHGKISVECCKNTVMFSAEIPICRLS